MAKPYLLGIDLGTMATKAGLFDAEGKLLAEAHEESRLIYPGPGWVQQDPEDIYGSALRTIRDCLERSRVNPADVSALAFAGQMSGIGTVDEDWGTPTVYDSWLDTRCGAYIPRLKALEDRIIALTGGFPTFSHGAKILWWKNERPEVYRKVAKFVVPGSYVAGRIAGLRGDQAFIDPTYLHFSCFSDTRNGVWSQELLSFFEVEAEKLPRIVAPGEIIGYVSAQAAAATGLRAGTPVAAGCGDQAAGMLGAAMVRPGMVFDVAGTASVFSVCLKDFVTDREHRTLFTARLPLSGLYYALAYINGGGLNLRWFRDQFAAEEVSIAAAEGASVYQVLDRAASDLPVGAGELLFLPHLGGRVCPSDPNTRGLFLGLNWAHTRAHLYRAMLEAVAYEYAYYLTIVRGLLPDLPVRETRVIGGGARSRLWNQIKSDVLGVPYMRLDREELAILGSAIVAGHAVGVFPDMAAAASSFVKVEEEIESNSDRHRVYRPYVDQYIRLLEASRPLFDGLVGLGHQRNAAAERSP